MDINILRALSAIKRPSFFGKIKPKWEKQYFQKESIEILQNFYYKILEHIEHEIVIECGAHEASTSIYAKGLGIRAFAIEANPSVYAEKTLMSADNGVETMNLGLGSESGELEFFIPKDSNCSGLSSFRKHKGYEYFTSKIPVTTLDELTKLHGIEEKEISLWIDVEGYSNEVLIGARELLDKDNCCSIFIELESSPIFPGQMLASGINDFLLSKGFIPLLTDSQSDNQFNVIYLKKKHLDKVSFLLKKAWMEISGLKFGLGGFLKTLINKNIKF